MMTTITRVALLTSGGDAPGLNAVIRAVVKSGIIRHRWEMVGVLDGFEGLVGEPRTIPLSLKDVSGLLPRGGSVLGCTNKGHLNIDDSGDIQATNAAFDQVLTNIAELGIDALIVLGGDGSHRIAHQLVRRGVHLVGVPKTIDNDLAGTDNTFGFDTAVAFATDAIDRLHTTAESHGRVIVVEVMGRDAGWIALFAGIAGGADVILIPEIPFLTERVAAQILSRAAAGKRFSIVVAAEGASAAAGSAGAGRAFDAGPAVRHERESIGARLTSDLAPLSGKEVRNVVLGHLQRGGSPTAADRLLASGYGAAAVRAVAEGRFGHMVASRAGRIELVPIADGIAGPRLVPRDHPLIATARDLGITFAGADDEGPREIERRS